MGQKKSPIGIYSIEFQWNRISTKTNQNHWQKRVAVWVMKKKNSSFCAKKQNISFESSRPKKQTFNNAGRYIQAFCFVSRIVSEFSIAQTFLYQRGVSRQRISRQWKQPVVFQWWKAHIVWFCTRILVAEHQYKTLSNLEVPREVLYNVLIFRKMSDSANNT